MIIGVMDSGIGGLNLLASLIKNRCGDRYLYLSDGENMPYGSKDRETLRGIALSGAKRLVELGANVLVYGCNTLSVTALSYVRKQVTPPVFGLIPRSELLCGKAILMTTPTTARYLPETEGNVTVIAPRELAFLIDADYPDFTRIRRCLRPLLSPYEDCESIYLGCSHYLFAKPIVQELLPHAKIADGVEPLAALIHAVLPQNDCKDPSVRFFFTGKDQTERYATLLSDLLK